MNPMINPDFRDADGEAYSCAFPVFEEKRMKETSDDFILPDYLPDIRKVVTVFPSAVIKGRFLGSGTLEFEGEAGYKMLYIAEDQSLRTATFATGFEDKIGNEDLTVECVDLVFPACENVVLRMLNPRKVNIRSSCGADVRVFKRQSALPRLTGAATLEDEAKLQCDLAVVPSVNVLDLRENGLTLSEDLSFDASAPTAVELLFGRALPVVQDCRVGEGEAQLRGKAQILCIVSTGKDENGREEFMPMTFSVPFSQIVKNDGLHEGGECFARIYPEGCEFRLREDEFGQKRVIEFDMTYLCDLTVFYPKTVTAVKDAFSLEKEVEPTAGERTFFSAPLPLRFGFSVGENVTLDLPEEGGYTLVSSFLCPEMHLAQDADKDGNAVLEGTCRIDLLLRDSAGAPDVRRTAVPLRFRTDRKRDDCFDAQLALSAASPRLRLDKNRLTCDFEINCFGQLLGRRNAAILTDLSLLPEKRQTPGKRGSVMICFPEKGEPLFAIAKKYGVPVSQLTAACERQSSKPARTNADQTASAPTSALSGTSPCATGAPIFIPVR